MTEETLDQLNNKVVNGSTLQNKIKNCKKVIELLKSSTCRLNSVILYDLVLHNDIEVAGHASISNSDIKAAIIPLCEAKLKELQEEFERL